MNDRLNKTSICSIVFLDIIDYSKKSDSDQIDIKTQFNDLISRSLKNVAQNDRIILDTGDGVVIALMGSPEDAMFVALNIRDGILEGNINNLMPLYVRFGINLGPVRTVSDINGQPNIIGDGINVAQRIMSFAQPNQILVSRTYYEVTSRLTLEFSEMFDYSGIKHDKHVREHEVYSVRSHKNEMAKAKDFSILKDGFKLTKSLAIANRINWKYAAPSLFVFLTLFGLVKLMPQAQPVTPSIFSKLDADTVILPESDKSIKMALIANEKIKNLATADSVSQSEIKATRLLDEVPKATIKASEADHLVAQERIGQDNLGQERSTKTKLAIKRANQKTAQEKTEILVISENAAIHTDSSKAAHKEPKSTEHDKKYMESVVAVKDNNKSGMSIFMDSFKQGQKNECSQAQISMNQCH